MHRVRFGEACWRCGRVATVSRNFATAPTTSSPEQSSTEQQRLRRIRNVGIMAHIDAGKTTTTEKMLFLAGRLVAAGDVDDGNTTTDFMDQERERGITIQSAAVSFLWDQHHINLIDTPGHVDFTIEVERSLRVLDGAVAVFDSVHGVQPQSTKVWRRADRHQLPRIVYANKMDRIGADLDKCLASVRSKLKTNPVAITRPVGGGGYQELTGIIDLISMEYLHYTDQQGDTVAITKESVATEIHSLHKEAVYHRARLVEALAEVDDAIAEKFLECSDDLEVSRVVSSQMIHDSLRRATLSGRVCPAVCGTSLRNRGVHSVLDSITRYLPSPLDARPMHAQVIVSNQQHQNNPKSKAAVTTSRSKVWSAVSGVAPDGSASSNSVVVAPNTSLPLAALAFKVSHHPHLGPLVFVRVYSGELVRRVPILNTSRNLRETPTNLVRIFANQYDEVESIKAGDIGAVVGLKNTFTGNTLTATTEGIPPILLEGIQNTNMVFQIALETATASQEKGLQTALVQLQREDPSLSVVASSESGQTLIGGFGELHLEVVVERLRREFNVDVTPGKMNVVYRESLTGECSITYTHAPTSNGKRSGGAVTIELRISPINNSESVVGGEDSNSVILNQSLLQRMSNKAEAMKRGDYPLGTCKLEASEVINALQIGIEDALSAGCLMGYPMTNTLVEIESLEVDSDVVIGTFRECGALGTAKALKESNLVHAMEPVVEMEVVTDMAYVGSVLSDLNSQRRAIIHAVDGASSVGGGGGGDGSGNGGVRDDHVSCIRCQVPLKETLGYASQLRSLTKGDASFSTVVAGYSLMPQAEEKQLLDQLFGRV